MYFYREVDPNIMLLSLYLDRTYRNRVHGVGDTEMEIEIDHHGNPIRPEPGFVPPPVPQQPPPGWPQPPGYEPGYQGPGWMGGADPFVENPGIQPPPLPDRPQGYDTPVGRPPEDEEMEVEDWTEQEIEDLLDTPALVEQPHVEVDVLDRPIRSPPLTRRQRLRQQRLDAAAAPPVPEERGRKRGREEEESPGPIHVGLRTMDRAIPPQPLVDLQRRWDDERGREARPWFWEQWLGRNVGPFSEVSTYEEAEESGPEAVAAWYHDLEYDGAETLADFAEADRRFLDRIQARPVHERGPGWHLIDRVIRSGAGTMYGYMYNKITNTIRDSGLNEL